MYNFQPLGEELHLLFVKKKLCSKAKELYTTNNYSLKKKELQWLIEVSKMRGQKLLEKNHCVKSARIHENEKLLIWTLFT